MRACVCDADMAPAMLLDPLNDGMAYGRMLQQDGSLFGASVSGFIIALVAGILVLGAMCGSCIYANYYAPPRVAPNGDEWEPAERSLIAFFQTSKPDFVLPAEMRAEAVRLFELADKDSNGKLDPHELSYISASPLVPPKAMEKTLDDGTGVATMREWLDYITLLAAMSKDEAKRQLALFDQQLSPPPGEEAKGEEAAAGATPAPMPAAMPAALSETPATRAGTLPPISGTPSAEPAAE